MLKHSQSTEPVVNQMHDENSSNSDDETSDDEQNLIRSVGSEAHVEGGNQRLLGQLRRFP